MARTEIRAATEADIPRMLTLGAIMHAESPRYRDFEFLPDRLAATVRQVLSMPLGFARVAVIDGQVVGGILAVAVPHYACDLVQACDIAYFVQPDVRGGTAAARLVDAYRAWAAEIGAEATIGINTGVQPERTARLLQALGAEQTGTVWTWRETCV